VRRLDLRAKAKTLVQNNLGAEIGQVKSFAQIGHGYDWKFQALTLMNAHQTDRIFRADGFHLGFGLGTTLGFDQAKKPEQTLALELVELLGRDLERRSRFAWRSLPRAWVSSQSP